MTKTLPCPFCGGKSQLYVNPSNHKHRVICNDCRASGPTREGGSEAVDMWNKLYKASISPEERVLSPAETFEFGRYSHDGSIWTFIFTADDIKVIEEALKEKELNER